ncbi:MAG: S-adenosylmethionine:tRNA ribosyltransferase-isomerase [Nocardioidaceae bacterium]
MSVATSPRAQTTFRLPAGVEASAPPERRGVARDGVRLLVVGPAQIRHVVFRDLTDHLDPGDLVVVNTSATLPAAVDGRVGALRIPVHVAAELDDGMWVVEPRQPDNRGPLAGTRRGLAIALAGGRTATLTDPYPVSDAETSRLWRAQVDPATPRLEFLSDHGRPIRYGYLEGSWPLRDFQTVYADEPGSAEMPSAGRPLTRRLLVRMLAKGISVAPVLLHTGVSSPEKHEPPVPEPFQVPDSTACLVRSARLAGRRIVAVGTTVVRALESAVSEEGEVVAARGWTDLVLGPDQPVRVVTGLVTGLHEPEASHLLLLEAVAGADLVQAAYREAVAERYLWHEFGDSMLFLP